MSFKACHDKNAVLCRDILGSMSVMQGVREALAAPEDRANGVEGCL